MRSQKSELGRTTDENQSLNDTSNACQQSRITTVWAAQSWASYADARFGRGGRTEDKVEDEEGRSRRRGQSRQRDETRGRWGRERSGELDLFGRSSRSTRDVPSC